VPPDPPSTARDEVRAALARGEAPERTCPVCGHTARTRDERCPRCSASYFARPPRLGARVRWALAAAVLAALVAGTVVVLQAQEDREARQEAERSARVAAEIRRLRRIQAPHRGAAADLRPPATATRAQRLAARRALVRAAERSITRDARKRVAAGELEGPIAGTACGPFLRDPDAVPDDHDLGRAIGRYDCLAAKGRGSAVRNAEGATVGRLGHPFVAALDFRRFTYFWCRNTPAPSERGKALAQVRLERACLAAKGRAVGTGYVDVP
jgi:hypothetical protein